MQKTQEMQVQPQGREDLLEKEISNHSSILTWKIPWTEEPGELQSRGSLRAGHDWETKHTMGFPICLMKYCKNEMQIFAMHSWANT